MEEKQAGEGRVNTHKPGFPGQRSSTDPKVFKLNIEACHFHVLSFTNLPTMTILSGCSVLWDLKHYFYLINIK